MTTAVLDPDVDFGPYADLDLTDLDAEIDALRDRRTAEDRRLDAAVAALHERRVTDRRGTR